MTPTKKKQRLDMLWSVVQALYNQIQPGSRFRCQNKLLHAKTLIDDMRHELMEEMGEAHELALTADASTKESDNGPKPHKKK